MRVDAASEALRQAAEAVTQSTLARNEQTQLRLALTGARHQIAALQAQLRNQQTIIGQQAAQLTLDRQVNEQHVTDLRQAIVWLGSDRHAPCASSPCFRPDA